MMVVLVICGGIVILVILGLGMALLSATHAPEGHEDAAGFHVDAEPHVHPQG
jgi:hypothetical protein